MDEVAQQLDMALTVGQLLKNARKEAGLSVEDVADHLRLTSDRIREIESDKLDAKHLTVFERGYIRTYARFVEVSADEIEAYFLSMGIIEPKQEIKPAKFEIKEISSKDKKVRTITYAMIIALLALVLIWVFWQRRGNDNVAATTVPTIVTTTATTPANTTANSNTETLADQFARKS